MLAAERMRVILQWVSQNSSVRVVDLAKEFGVSGETIRRDLEAMEREGLVRRVHGGAVDARQRRVKAYRDREAHRTLEKQAIGSLAATLVQDGDTLIVDVGTTVLAFCEHLRERRDLTVITPSLQAALLVKQRVEGARVFVTGGELQEEEPYLSGGLACDMLRGFHAQKAFVSAGGVSIDTGLTDFNDREVRVRRCILESADQVVVLADSSKIGVKAFAVIGPLSAMDVLVTDDQIPPDARVKLEDLGVEVMVAPRDGVS